MVVTMCSTTFGQVSPIRTGEAPVQNDGQAEEILKKAIAHLGGAKYLSVSSQIGQGRFSVIRDGTVISFRSFHDVIVYPDRERTEFKGGGSRSVQVNTGDTGWLYDGDMDVIRDQTEIQIANFKRGMAVSLDALLRGHWRGKGSLAYVGKRPSTLGKRNDVIKLTYESGTVVEFEFADDGTPQKAIHKRTNADGEETVEEDRYAQFIENSGIRSPFIIDRFTDGKHTSRINYQSVEFNRSVADSIFEKPNDVKALKKSLKL